MLLDVLDQMRSIEETAVSAGLSVSATTLLWWLRGEVDGHRIREHNEGPLAVITTLYWGDWEWPYDDADEEDLLPGATYSVLELGPQSCRLDASWAGGQQSEYYPRYRHVVEAAIAEFGAREDTLLPSAPSETTSKHGRPTPRAETVRRAQVFRTIKDANPHYSYAEVAREATRSARLRAGQGEPVSEYKPHNVRDAYEAMGWNWESGRTIR